MPLGSDTSDRSTLNTPRHFQTSKGTNTNNFYINHIHPRHPQTPLTKLQKIRILTDFWIFQRAKTPKKCFLEARETTQLLSRKRRNDTCFFSPVYRHIFFPIPEKKCVQKEEKKNKCRFSSFQTTISSFLLCLDTFFFRNRMDISSRWSSVMPSGSDTSVGSFPGIHHMGESPFRSSLRPPT